MKKILFCNSYSLFELIICLIALLIYTKNPIIGLTVVVTGIIINGVIKRFLKLGD